MKSSDDDLLARIDQGLADAVRIRRFTTPTVDDIFGWDDMGEEVAEIYDRLASLSHSVETIVIYLAEAGYPSTTLYSCSDDDCSCRYDEPTKVELFVKGDGTHVTRRARPDRSTLTIEQIEAHGLGEAADEYQLDHLDDHHLLTTLWVETETQQEFHDRLLQQRQAREKGTT